MKILKRLKKIVLSLLVLAAVVAAGWWTSRESEFFAIREVDVQVEFEESQEALLSELVPVFEKQLMALKGKNVWQVSLARLVDDLSAVPWVQKVELSRRIPDKVSAFLRIEPVSFLFLDKKNNIYPILQSGKKLQKIKAALAPDAPILRNNNIYKEQKQLSRLIELYDQVPRVGPLLAENIASVDFNELNGLTVELIKQKVTVHFGSESIQTKGLQVLRVLDYLESQKHKARVIDASFKKKVLVRLRKRS